MASHHHNCHPSAAVCYCHCCQPACTPCHRHHPPPPPPPDPHLHVLHPPHLYPLQSHPQISPLHFHEQERTETHPLVSSLIRRIAALESALRRRSSPAQSLRDAAARSIQAHFRAFLVRRSITLRHLKELASIKSNLGFLKSSISERPNFDYDAVYHKVANLLLKLDAIQGGDPMIRNGKSSLKREIYRFLDFIEGAIAVNVRQSAYNLRSRVSKKGSVESGCSKLRGLMERIDRLAEELDDEEECQETENPSDEFVKRKHGVSATSGGGLLKQRGVAGPKVKKNVTFAENGKVYRVLGRHTQPYLHDEEVLDDDDDDDDDLCREVEEIGLYPKEGVEEESEGGSIVSAPLMERRSK